MAFPEFPTSDDVLTLIRHQYSDEEFDEVMALLAPVNHDDHCGWTPARIRLVALAMSKGNKTRISQWIELDNSDCRDLQLAVHDALGANWDRECLVDVVR